MQHNSCIVLAGGLGTRLRNAVPSVPKCLAPIGAQPFLRWQLESLSQRGVEHFVLSLGSGFSQVLEAIQEPWAKNLKIEYIIETHTLGTGGAARFAMVEFNINEALVINGDTFLGGSLDHMFAPLEVEGGEIMRIATVNVQDRSRFGGIEVDEGNYVINFLEKGQVGPGLINAGLYRIGIAAFSDQPSSAFSMETVVMPKLVVRRSLRACELTGPFIDIGIPDDYYHFGNFYQNYIDCK